MDIEPFAPFGCAHNFVKFDDFTPDCWRVFFVDCDNGVHEAIKIADCCIDVFDAGHFAKMVEIGGFGACSCARFFDLLLLDDSHSAFHACFVFGCPCPCWGEMVKCKMSFDSFWLEDCMLVGPCGRSDGSCEWLIEQLSLEVACRCEAVVKVVHFGCYSFDGRLENSGGFAVLVRFEDLDEAVLEDSFFELLGGCSVFVCFVYDICEEDFVKVLVFSCFACLLAFGARHCFRRVFGDG